ncbi:MAG: PepSY-associated TM helix domain-containing protein, partial [Pseudomonadota bacterium]
QEGTAQLLNDVQIERSGTAAPLRDPVELLAVAEAQWGPDQVSQVEVRFPGDANARIILNRHAGVGTRLGDRLIFDGVSGELLQSTPGTSSGVVKFAIVMLGLHEGTFAGPLLRWLYVISGLLGTAMIATGAIHWTAKRRRKTEEGPEGFGFRLVECLNIGTIIGLPVGIAAFFLANRLLPLEMAHRIDWEIHVLFLTWLACVIYPAVRGRADSWRDLSWVAAIAFLAVPVINAATSELHLGNTIPDRDWVLAGFDLACLGMGATFSALAIYLGRGTKKAAGPADLEAGAVAPSGS